MQIVCSHCHKTYSIPDERFERYKKDLSLPCPNCKKSIEIKFDSKAPGNGGTQDEQVTGQALKDQIFKTLQDLPPMPQVAQKARELMKDPDSSISQLAQIIETDQGIVTRVLKIANSSYYGMSGRVSSVKHASVILGTQTLMELLNLACSSSILGQNLNGYDLEPGDLWRHSLAVAAGSQIIARKKRPELEQNAFSAGLIHDAGKLILDPYILERKEAFERFLKDGQRSFLDAERALLGFDHSEIAAEVCGKWQIPKELALAIRYHHNPAQAEDNMLANIIHVADAIAIMSGIGGGVDGLLYALDETALGHLDLDSEEMEEIMGAAAEYVEETSEAA